MTWVGVRLATVGPLPPHRFAANTITMTANGALSIDGMAVAPGDRVLIKDEAASPDHPENGIYTVTNPGSSSARATLVRAADWNAATELQSGNAILVLLGTQGGQVWYLATAGAIALNTTALEFRRASSPLSFENAVADVVTYRAHKMGLAPSAAVGCSDPHRGRGAAASSSSRA